jgi:predicted acyltransferase
MLIVNNMPLDQATPTQFQHARWGEWIRLADLVFPWFLLCAGLSLPFSYRSAKRRGITNASWVLKALGRAVGLLLLGMFLDSAYNRQPTLGLGVLQLIGLASFVAALLMPLKPLVRGILAAAAILGYGAALALLPVPDQGRRVLSEHANLVLYLNDTYFKEVGLRGLPSVLPTSALVVLGSLVGGALAKAKRRVRVIGCGFVLALIGAIWTRGGHPMSKDIWTAPYILFSGGIGTMIVAALSWLLDGRSWAKLAAPLLVFGMNPLVAYAGPIMVKCLVLQSWTFDDGRTLQQAWIESMVYRFGIYYGSWLYTLEYILATWIVLVWLRRRGVVLRL